MNPIMTIRAPQELQRELSRQAQKMGFTRSTLVLNILWDWLKRQPKD